MRRTSTMDSTVSLLRDTRKALTAFTRTQSNFLWTDLRLDVMRKQQAIKLQHFAKHGEADEHWNAVLDQVAHREGSSSKSLSHTLKKTKNAAHNASMRSLLRAEPTTVKEGVLWGLHFLAFWYNRLALAMRPITESSVFRFLSFLIVVIAGVVVGGQTYDWSDSVKAGLEYADTGILWLFVLEAALKLVAAGVRPLDYFRDGWNVFDFLIVFVSFLPVGAEQIKVLRLIRLLRVLKVIRVLPKLRVLVTSMLKSLSSLGYVSLLLLLLFYLYGVIGVVMFSKNDPANFESLHVAMITLFRITTGDDWTDIMYINLFGCDEYGYRGEGGRSDEGIDAYCTTPDSSPWTTVLFFISYVFLTALMIVNLVVGVIVSSTEEAQAEYDDGTKVTVTVKGCKNLIKADVIGTSDPYVVLTMGNVSQKTSVKKHTLNPRWAAAEFTFFPMEELGPVLHIQVRDWDRLSSDDDIGWATLDVGRLPCIGSRVDVCRTLKGVESGEIYLSVVKDVPESQLDPAEMQPEDRLLMQGRKLVEMWDEVKDGLTEAAEERQDVMDGVQMGPSKRRLSAYKLPSRTPSAAIKATASALTGKSHEGDSEEAALKYIRKEVSTLSRGLSKEHRGQSSTTVASGRKSMLLLGSVAESGHPDDHHDVD